jgi:hypothetical protein
LFSSCRKYPKHSESSVGDEAGKMIKLDKIKATELKNIKCLFDEISSSYIRQYMNYDLELCITDFRGEQVKATAPVTPNATAEY